MSLFLGDTLKYFGVKCNDVCNLSMDHKRETEIKQMWQYVNNWSQLGEGNMGGCLLYWFEIYQNVGGEKNAKRLGEYKMYG